MVGLVIAIHGRLADGLVDAASLIFGDLKNCKTVSLTENDGIEDFAKNVQEAIQAVEEGDGVLVMVDLLGTSPFNVASQLAVKSDKVDVVTGVNLPCFLKSHQPDRAWTCPLLLCTPNSLAHSTFACCLKV